MKTALKNEASSYFQKKDYTHALPLYRELLNLYPKDHNYQYHTALCLLNLNQEIEEAIDLLQTASVERENPLATFYLARAYHLHYAFEDAIKTYSLFLKSGKKADIRKLEVQRMIEMAKNGINLTREAKSFTVKSTSITPVYQLENAYTISTNGKVIRKPVEFNTKYDQKMNFNSLMYLPAYTEINEFVYVSGYSNAGKKSKDIFRIKNINHQLWDMPEPLSKIINTTADEDYPFFHTRTSTLYFCSKGHSSMGGYDIFSSVYDWNTKTWSKPRNLGFPINSPYDDFMMVCDDPGQTAQFASNRSTVAGMATLYRIILNNNEDGTKQLSVDEIRALSELSVASPAERPPADSISVVFSKPYESEEDLPAPKFDKNLYNLLIAGALSLQLKADSLSDIAKDQRILAKETSENESRKQIISDILDLEREAKKVQREADEKFLEARKMKNAADTLPESDTNIVVYKEINGIKVYQYKTQEASQNTIGLPGEDSGLMKKNLKEDEAFNQFKILEHSPYYVDKPIPQLPLEEKGLVYRIQLGVFSKPKEASSFGGLYPVYSEWLAEKNVYKYYTGEFSNSSSVATALEKVRNHGFPDAFVVAFYNARPITTEKAREIEFEGLRLQ
ncbi:MAG: hypothetical protein JXK95_06505 [Bacteroidales bacterium]|nr:hypothetical protein [Bacteroidales bacterium]